MAERLFPAFYHAYEISSEMPVKAGVSVVGNCPKHRPHNAQIYIQRRIRCHFVAHDGGNHLPAHLYEVRVRHPAIDVPGQLTLAAYRPSVLKILGI